MGTGRETSGVKWAQAWSNSKPSGHLDQASQSELETCSRKQVFLSRRDARRKARQVWSLHGQRMRVYRCRWCGLYHLTTKR